MKFQPDYTHFTDVMRNRRPARLPLYEHIVSDAVMEAVLGVRFAELAHGDAKDRLEFFRQRSRFFREQTYDTVSYEVCIGETLPGRLALRGGQGPIQSRADFEAYPWAEQAERFWRVARPRLDALVATLPPGMKAVKESSVRAPGAMVATVLGESEPAMPPRLNFTEMFDSVTEPLL